MEQAVIENDTCKTAGNGNKRYTPQVFRRQMDKKRKGKTCRRSEKELGHNGGGNSGSHCREKNSARKIAVELLQSEHRSRQGSIKRRRKTRAGAAGDEIPFLHACPSHEAAQALGGNGADLNRRPFTAQRQARADA